MVSIIFPMLKIYIYLKIRFFLSSRHQVYITNCLLGNITYMFYWLTQVAIANYHRVNGLNNRHLFLKVLED